MVAAGAEVRREVEQLFLAMGYGRGPAPLGCFSAYVFSCPACGSASVVSIFHPDPRRLAERRGVCALAGWKIHRIHYLSRRRASPVSPPPGCAGSRLDSRHKRSLLSILVPG